ncbi:MAG: hypothetical protein IPL65_17675 [Lewinellaceae bacterium]|nr:hypothetical protein [Lewinellaceae bacterium]
MKSLYLLPALLCISFYGQAQKQFTAIGAGYSTAQLTQQQFSDLIVAVNNNNASLSQPFSREDQYQGYNVFMAFMGEKALFSINLSKLRNKYQAMGTIPAVSTNEATYTITSSHTNVGFGLDYFPVSFLGLGVDAGYNYSTFKNAAKDLFFGESNSVVDKKGGLMAGVNVILQIPLGQKAFLQLQPFYTKALYKNDMNNLAIIYLGANNTASETTTISGFGGHVKLGIKIQ